jgi:phosphoesterase RecJ-like protein
MFRDDGDVVKMSLRSSGEYDVGTIAVALGGGGHSHSAATIINREKDESLDQVILKTISRLEEALKNLEND